MRRPTIHRHWKTMLLCSLVFASCAHTPRVTEESESLLTIRRGYLETHPDGQFNPYIVRGEVVPGMDFMDVLASWGIPASRIRDKKGIENWIYLAEDHESGDWVRYTFSFEKYTLAEWQISRHNSKNGALVYWEPRSLEPTPLQPNTPAGSNLSSLKR